MAVFSQVDGRGPDGPHPVAILGSMKKHTNGPRTSELLGVHFGHEGVLVEKGTGVPSDTKLLLTKNYSKISIFKKLRISRVIL